MELIKTCSLEDHKELQANLYCSQCRINMCKKCENMHNILYSKIINLIIFQQIKKKYLMVFA